MILDQYREARSSQRVEEVKKEKEKLEQIIKEETAKRDKIHKELSRLYTRDSLKELEQKEKTKKDSIQIKTLSLELSNRKKSLELLSNDELVKKVELEYKVNPDFSPESSLTSKTSISRGALIWAYSYKDSTEYYKTLVSIERSDKILLQNRLDTKLESEDLFKEEILSLNSEKEAFRENNQVLSNAYSKLDRENKTLRVVNTFLKIGLGASVAYGISKTL